MYFSEFTKIYQRQTIWNFGNFLLSPQRWLCRLKNANSEPTLGVSSSWRWVTGEPRPVTRSAGVAVAQGRQRPRDKLRGKIIAFSRLSLHFHLKIALVLRCTPRARCILRGSPRCCCHLKSRDLALETPHYLPKLPWYKADSDLGTNSEVWS